MPQASIAARLVGWLSATHTHTYFYLCEDFNRCNVLPANDHNTNVLTLLLE